MDAPKIYQSLLKRFGKQNWWPVLGSNPEFEIAIGTILTQQTTWQQVEKAITDMINDKLLTPRKLSTANIAEIHEMIRPTGFYRQKSNRIINFSNYLVKNYDSDIRKLLSKPDNELRQELLNLEGIGKETADSILLYAANKLIFPVDAYTFRIFSRLGVKTNSYDELQGIIQNKLPKDLETYKEFHALLVMLGKTYCKSKPQCSDCPLNVSHMRTCS